MSADPISVTTMRATLKAIQAERRWSVHELALSIGLQDRTLRRFLSGTEPQDGTWRILTDYIDSDNEQVREKAPAPPPARAPHRHFMALHESASEIQKKRDLKLMFDAVEANLRDLRELTLGEEQREVSGGPSQYGTPTPVPNPGPRRNRRAGSRRKEA